MPITLRYDAKFTLYRNGIRGSRGRNLELHAARSLHMLPCKLESIPPEKSGTTDCEWRAVNLDKDSDLKYQSRNLYTLDTHPYAAKVEITEAARTKMDGHYKVANRNENIIKNNNLSKVDDNRHQTLGKFNQFEKLVKTGLKNWYETKVNNSVRTSI